MKNVTVWSRSRLFLPGAGADPIWSAAPGPRTSGAGAAQKKVAAPQHRLKLTIKLWLFLQLFVHPALGSLRLIYSVLQVRAGLAYIPRDELLSLVVGVFRAKLSHNLALTCR